MMTLQMKSPAHFSQLSSEEYLNSYSAIYRNRSRCSNLDICQTVTNWYFQRFPLPPLFFIVTIFQLAKASKVMTDP